MMLDSLRPHFDREKFKDVVHFICSNCAPEDLGNVKLHKILYFSDMMAFLGNGVPLTGVEYRKQQFGPTASHLSWAISQLTRDGRLRVEERDYFGYRKKDYISLASVKSGALSNEECQLLLDVIGFVCQKSAREISEISHDTAWHAARMGEVIPYYAAYGLLPAEVSDLDIDEAVEEARRMRPLIDAR